MRRDPTAKRERMPRRRHPGLIPLSHEHREALGLAFRLHNPSPPGPVTAMTPASTPQSRAAETLAFFDGSLRRHFRAEEDLLFPFLETHLPAGAAERALLPELVSDHARLTELRDAVAAATDEDALASALTAFADLLEAHVRREERELFDLFPGDAARAQVDAVAASIRQALGVGGG
jgi:hemerythrin-like domain-containing protein